MQNFSEYLTNLNRKIKIPKKEIMFICIGTNEIIWDSIGPYVGTYLKQKIREEIIIGDLKNNICSKNDLKKYYPKVENKFIIAIDSAITEKGLQGEIFITDKPLIMGAGINKNKGKIGNISIKASVNKNITDKNYIKEYSKMVSKGLYYWYENIIKK